MGMFGVISKFFNCGFCKTGDIICGTHLKTLIPSMA